MSEKTGIEKLRILLPHWIEHNHNHGMEFKQWAEMVRREGAEEVAVLLEKAIACMEETDRIFDQALGIIGGPLSGHHHHHGHDHD